METDPEAAAGAFGAGISALRPHAITAIAASAATPIAAANDHFRF